MSVRTGNSAASVHFIIQHYMHVCVCLPLPPHSSDVMEEAKKLIGTGNKHLVMGDVVSAVNVFQDACSML